MLRLGDIVISHEKEPEWVMRVHRIGVITRLWPPEQQPSTGSKYCLVRWPIATDPEGFNDNEAYHPMESLEVIGHEVRLPE